jgi:hypothetical protein
MLECVEQQAEWVRAFRLYSQSVQGEKVNRN